MREIRQSGSEGGAAFNSPSLPLSFRHRTGEPGALRTALPYLGSSFLPAPSFARPIPLFSGCFSGRKFVTHRG